MEKEKKQYESPKLELVGPADEVVQGPPSAGWDGFYGMSDAAFEYEQD
ncbi:MAG: hypothetical protein HY313_09795 [Acidobacteria bacterium]|nr:hypothetical protein [Acidobacteriota bacterium]